MSKPVNTFLKVLFYTHVEEHRLKPYELRKIPKHTCIFAHCEKGHKRVTLPPIEPDGRVCSWF